ncbi:SDR family oxidoreductase [Dissulfurispira thermophila]|uniref:SDR family oxidoreductase n=1 Tax=Dissulfurispira thermophila TaxID=2715679 RepID=A0A7G1H304_9BACT|nr:oxidoreductase [Dissulfurispira thermophila]BCB96326.1 SDR family oxidoreductase [Dissulfurispira thermophila]
MLLKDKIIVVIGGEGLLGKAIVNGILHEGGVPISADIKPIKDSNNDIDYIMVDITSKKSINDCIEIVYKKYGKIDALVNTAYPRNKNYGRNFLEVEFEDFCENLNIHLGGYFLTSQQFIKFFLKQGFGNIINFSSIYGVIAPSFEIYAETTMTMPVEYAAIKSAIIHLTRYMAKFLKGKNIRVNCISPGGIMDKQPINFIKNYNSLCLNKGMLDKDDIIGTVIFLLGDISKYINGQNIIVDDGYSL